MKMRVLPAIGAAAVALMATAPAFAQTSLTAETPTVDGESIVGGTPQKLPTPPVLFSRFTLPMVIKVAQDAGITTNTPITDQLGTDLPKWSESIRACLKSKPVLVRVVKEESVPFVINKTEGTTKLNANGKAVCRV